MVLACNNTTQRTVHSDGHSYKYSFQQPAVHRLTVITVAMSQGAAAFCPSHHHPSKAVVGHIGRLLTACTRAERVRPTALRGVCLRRMQDVASSDRGLGMGKGRPHIRQAMSPPTKRLAAPRSLTADSSDTATSILRPPDRFARASLAPGNTCRAAFAPTANILTCVTSRTNGGCNSTWRRRCL